MEIGNITPYIPTTDNTNQINSKLEKAYTEKDDAQLKEVCQDFESIFVNMMLKEMRKSVNKSGLMGDSFATQTFEEMYDEELSKSISKGKGIGIADMMYKQLSYKLNNTYKVVDKE